MISAAPRRDSSRLRLVLLVDRDDDTREMYAEYFAAAAVSIQQAADGRDALARAIARPPDLIVTETRLPGLDGYELCALLRAEPKTRTVPIVVVTGDGYQADVDHARTAGADLVLIKPCLPEVLLTEMRRLVAQAPDKPRRSSPAKTRAMSRAGKRQDTTIPPAAPPVLVCPTCHQFLIYQRSHVGTTSTGHTGGTAGARQSEQWDYFECAAGCGVFQYRQRTQALRRV
jgi:CheY-like chemotaxis protein